MFGLEIESNGRIWQWSTVRYARRLVRIWICLNPLVEVD